MNLPAPEGKEKKQTPASRASGNGAGATAERKTQKADQKPLPTAPSLGPNTVIEREPVEERLARHEQSEVDAMGKDKRRGVVGVSYGPSRARQAALYGIFLAVVAAIAIGGKILIDNLDQPPAKIANQAPWSGAGVHQVPPKPIQ